MFFIKYLHTLGFDATNDIFAENAWSFRNALVRANYNDLKKGIHATTEYLELFLKNLLLGENNKLHNRSMHISGMFSDIQKQDIAFRNSFDSKLRTVGFSRKTLQNVEKMYAEYGYEAVFGRGDVIKILGITESPASELLKKLLSIEVIEAV